MPPPTIEADATVFHEFSTPNAPPKVQHFVGTVNLDFSIRENKRSDTNIYILLKRVMAFAKQTNTKFRIEPLNGSAQCINNPSSIPTTKESVDLYYQHRVVTDIIRGKLNVATTRTMGEMKEHATHFHNYLNQDKVYISPAVMGLADTRIIGVVLQTDPRLTFRDYIKATIIDIMSNKTALSVFADNPRFTNDLAIQVVIKDGNETEAYIEKLTKAMEFVN
jgi:hypothetical protein